LLVPQTAGDLYTLIGTVAAIIVAVIALQERFRPREAPMTKGAPAKKSSSTAKISPTLNRAPIVLAIVACAAFAADIIDRHYFANQADVETPIESSNAKFDVVIEKPVWRDTDKQEVLNLDFKNNGKATAIGLAHSELRFPNAGIIDPVFIDVLFLTMRMKIKSFKLSSTDETSPSSGQIKWFSAPYNLPPPMEDSTYNAAKNGQIYVYTFVLIKYSDETVRSGRAIYGEICSYTIGSELVHNCDNGHNRTYIADSD
jgi:hypothetical protein